METIAFNVYSYKEGVGEKIEKSTNLLSKIAWGIFGFSHCKNLFEAKPIVQLNLFALLTVTWFDFRL